MREIRFTPMNGKLMLFPPNIADKTQAGIALTQEQVSKRMLQADQIWEVAAIDPTAGLDIKAGDYVYLDIQATGDILETELEGHKVFVVSTYAVLAKASEEMAESMKATKGMVTTAQA